MLDMLIIISRLHVHPAPFRNKRYARLCAVDRLRQRTWNKEQGFTLSCRADTTLRLNHIFFLSLRIGSLGNKIAPNTLGAEAASRVAVLLMVERLRLCAAKVLGAVQRRCQVADISPPAPEPCGPTGGRTLVGHDRLP